MPVPFRRILVPYDGSEPSGRALAFGIALGRLGIALDVAHVVDETPVFSQSEITADFYDPTPIIDALDEQGRALLGAVAERCRAAGVEVTTELVHDQPVVGILTFAERYGDELIVLGTHARSGLPRTFLGSTTEGVLRNGTLPVLAVSTMMSEPHEPPFGKVLVAIDESDPADAAAALAGRLSQTLGTRSVLCSVADTRDLYDKAVTYGYDPTVMVDELRDHAQDVIDRARVHGGFAADTVTTIVLEDQPGRGIIAEAERSGVDAIVMGSHGRRGLQRLFLGSVAEHVVRHSPVPVFVVHAARR